MEAIGEMTFTTAAGEDLGLEDEGLGGEGGGDGGGFFGGEGGLGDGGGDVVLGRAVGGDEVVRVGVYGADNVHDKQVELYCNEGRRSARHPHLSLPARPPTLTEFNNCTDWYSWIERPLTCCFCKFLAETAGCERVRFTYRQSRWVYCIARAEVSERGKDGAHSEGRPGGFE